MANYIMQPAPLKPLIIADDVIPLAGIVTVTLSALATYLFAFELAAPTTFSGAKWRTGSTATGSSDAGIYTFAGTLLANVGGLANVASTSVAQAFSGGNITLPPGQYFAAFAAQNATDTYLGINATSTPATIPSRWRQATNNATVPVSVVVLPSSTGGYATLGSTKIPGFSLTVVGGL